MAEAAIAIAPVVVAAPGADKAPVDTPNGAVQPPPETPPKVYAGRFKSAEELEKSYVELEKKFSSTRPAKPDSMQIAPPEVEDNADIPTLIEKAGLNTADLETHWTEHGKLSDEQYTAIRKVRPGLSKRDVDFIAEGLQAKGMLADIKMRDVNSQCEVVAGGAAQLKSLLAQAATFVEPAEQPAINKLLKDPATAKAAVRVLMQMHADSAGAGKSKPLIGGSSIPVGAGATSLDEYGQLMNAASRGDQAAQRRILATSPETLEAWSKK